MRIHRLLLAGAATALIAVPSTVAAPTVEQQGATTTLKGTFVGTAKYTGSGNASVTRRSAIRTLRLARNFRADSRAVQLRMYLATSASGGTHIDLGSMAESGAQSFRVPRGVNLGRYRYVVAWCAAVNEPITSARLVTVKRR